MARWLSSNQPQWKLRVANQRRSNMRRQSAQLLIDQRQKLLGGVGFALPNGVQPVHSVLAGWVQTWVQRKLAREVPLPDSRKAAGAGSGRGLS